MTDTIILLIVLLTIAVVIIAILLNTALWRVVKLERASIKTLSIIKELTAIIKVTSDDLARVERQVGDRR